MGCWKGKKIEGYKKGGRDRSSEGRVGKFDTGCVTGLLELHQVDEGDIVGRGKEVSFWGSAVGDSGRNLQDRVCELRH